MNDIWFIIMLDVLNMVRVVDTVQVADTVHMVLAAYKSLQQKATCKFIYIWLQCRRQTSSQRVLLEYLHHLWSMSKYRMAFNVFVSIHTKWHKQDCRTRLCFGYPDEALWVFSLQTALIFFWLSNLLILSETDEDHSRNVSSSQNKMATLLFVSRLWTN